MKNNIFVITLLILSLLCISCTTNAEYKEKTVILSNYEVLIPAEFVITHNEDDYKEFVLRNNDKKPSETITFSIIENCTIEMIEDASYNNLHGLKKERLYINNINVIDSDKNVEGSVLQYEEKNMNATLILLPCDDNLLAISLYLKSDIIKQNIIDSIKYIE